MSKKLLPKSLLVIGILSLGFLTTAGDLFKPLVIYGDDNRQEAYAVKDEAIKMAADATVAMIPKNKLTEIENDLFSIATKNYGQDYNLCTDEAFYDQPVAANCSGFLVGEDLIATAGHCISEYECADNTFVFGFANKEPGAYVSEISKSEVYNCKEIVAREMSYVQDYALVRLDRKVTGHTPLKMAESSVAVGDSVTVIGHPAGLPTKVADGATVRSQEGAFFVTNTDTYGGNSGSAVFNTKTLEVVGILVRGEMDFTYDSDKACTVSYKCEMEDCRGEDVTNIYWISNAIPKKISKN